MRKLRFLLSIAVCFAGAFFSEICAQDDSTKKFKHKFTTFQLEARAELDYIGAYSIDQNFANPTIYDHFWDGNSYGFHGQYFNFLLGGDIGEHISYFIRQRIIPKAGTVNFFDNTDFLYLQYRFNKNWAVRLGKEALYIGGYEYDAPPIDVYYYTHFWGEIYCFHIGTSVAYTDNSGKNKIVFQFANSPYSYYAGQGNEWKKGLFSYNLFWSGNFNHFSTLYSINFMEYKRGKFINYISLGNKLSFNKFQIYFDYMNRASSFENFFKDFTIVSRLDWQVGNGFDIFAKAGYDQNFSQQRFTNPENIIDNTMVPGANYYFYGLGLEYRPPVYPDLRIHAYVANSTFHYPQINNYILDEKKCNLMANIGATWKIDFMKYLPEKLK